MKSNKLSKRDIRLQNMDERLRRLHEALELADVPKRGRSAQVAAKTGYAPSMVPRILAGNVPLTMRFITSVCSAYSFNVNFIETGASPWYVLGTPNILESHDEDDTVDMFMESVVIKEALKELQLMPEPKRWEAVAMLKRMNSEESTK